MSKANYEEMRDLVDSAMNGEFDRKKLKEKREAKELADKEKAGKKDLIAEATAFLSREL